MKRANWDKYKRMQCNIDKAVANETASTLMEKHYQALRKCLVKSALDEDIFNDAFLKITYKYNKEMDFVDQFTHLFKQLKGEYKRDDCAIHSIQLEEERLAIPETLTAETPARKSNIISKIQALCKS